MRLRKDACLIGVIQVKYFGSFKRGDIAQLARAPALQAGGLGFESPCLHHFYNFGRLAQLVRARH